MEIVCLFLDGAVVVCVKRGVEHLPQREPLWQWPSLLHEAHRVCLHRSALHVARFSVVHRCSPCHGLVQVTASVVIDRFRSSFSFCLVSDSPRFSLTSVMLVACGVVPIAELKSLRLITPSPLASSSCHALHSNASAIVSGTVCVRARARASRECASLWA